MDREKDAIMEEINQNELVDFQTVHIDAVGNIYEYHGRIIRIINSEYTNETRDLLKKMDCLRN